LAAIVRTLERKGASLRATEQPIDISSAAGRCFRQILGVFAEFETNPRRERQLEGIAKAKAAGKYRRRPRGIDAAKIGELQREGLGATEIARRLGIARVGLPAQRLGLASEELERTVHPPRRQQHERPDRNPEREAQVVKARPPKGGPEMKGGQCGQRERDPDDDTLSALAALAAARRWRWYSR
jgi:hypothetical protein